MHITVTYFQNQRLQTLVTKQCKNSPPKKHLISRKSYPTRSINETKKNRTTKLVAPPITKPTQDALNFTKKEPNLKRTREKKKRERFSNHKHKIKEKEERKEREGERVSPQKRKITHRLQLLLDGRRADDQRASHRVLHLLHQRIHILQSNHALVHLGCVGGEATRVCG